MIHSDRIADSPASEPDAKSPPVQAGVGPEQARNSYLDQAKRGQALLERGEVSRAEGVFRATLAGLGDEPSYERAVIMERLGRCLLAGGSAMHAAGMFQQAMEVTESIPLTVGVKALQSVLQSALGDALDAIGHLDEAQKAYEAAVAVAVELKDRRAEGVDRDHLGGLALRQGRIDEARAHYEAALRLFQQLGERMAQAVARHHLGDVSAADEKWTSAEAHFLEAARIRESCEDWGGAAQSWSRVAAASEKAGKLEAADAWYRKAIEVSGQTRNPLLIRRHLVELARFLQDRPGRLAEARQVVDAALASLTLETYAPDVWTLYAIAANIAEKQAAATADETVRAPLQVQAANFRKIQQYGPRLHATLIKLGGEPGYARAVILERLGRCFLMGGRPALAAAFLGSALGLAEQLAPSGDARTLRGLVQSELGDAMRGAGHPDEARKAYEAALQIAEEAGDLRAQGVNLDHLDALTQAEGAPDGAQERYLAALQRFNQSKDATRKPASDAEFDVRLYDERITDCAFDTDLLVDIGRAFNISRWSETSELLADDLRPMLRPCTRTYLDEDGAVRFCLALEEPELERHADCVVMRKTNREVAVSGNAAAVWRLMRAVDGARTVKEVLAELAAEERHTSAQLLADLAAVGVIDASGRPIGRFVHAATKKGVVLGGGLAGDDVLRLATDGNYRTYAEAAHVALGDAVPEKLRQFHGLTRARRSRRDYAGVPIKREDFAALLHTACGVTDTMPWEGRELKLRAYPSSGALYAVEIYPVVLCVDGLDPGVYHYVPGESTLEAVRPDAGQDAIVAAALPVERQMVSGAAVMICLVGEFRRHERKYGEGGYRMMVAEAGHISQNLVLAATALGLAARPFGGVFDRLMNRALGLEEAEEQFLLSVLVGHAGGAEAPHTQRSRARDQA